MDAARLVRARLARLAGRTGRGRPARLVAAFGRQLARRREKGGGQVARTFLGKKGSRYHLAVDRHGAPLAVLVSAGNENERRYLLPLVDELLARGLHPQELWADRGYASQALEHALRDRAIEPKISQPRRAGQPIPADTPSREIWRGRRRRLKTSDPHAPTRWPVERTNAWLKAHRRIATRRDRKPETYHAFIQLAMILILHRSF
jgi:transposase